MKKRILCMALTLIMVIGIIPTIPVAHAGTYGNLTYKYDDYLYITGCVEGATRINIPAKIDGISVRGIARAAFSDCENLISVTFEEGIKYIESYAFSGCTSLTSISLPDSIISISYDAFSGCSSLCSVKLPSNIQGIGDGVFTDCTSLERIELPDSVRRIGLCAFQRCKNLKSINIPDGVTTIDNYAFEDCMNLISINIPKSVTYIGTHAFNDCPGLKTVYITDIAAWCGIEFKNEDSNPCYEGASLYVGANKVANVVVPDGVTSIGNYTFYGMEQILSVKLPGTVQSIGNYAFSGCVSLNSINVPDGVTSINIGAFYNCENLKSITLPGSLSIINSNSFARCKALTSIDIPDNVTIINNYAFIACLNLKKISLSEKTDIIGEEAFAGCDAAVIYIPKSTALIKKSAFKMSKVKYVYYGGSESDKQNLTIQSDNDSLNLAKWVYNAAGLPECKYDNACDSECNICGQTRQIVHSFGGFVSDNNATIYEDGTMTRVCSVCGERDTIADEGSKLTIEIKDTSKIFKDIPAKKWFKEYVDYSVAYGIFSGTSKDTFSPNDNITRAQFVQVLANLEGIDTSNRNVTTQFKDVPAKKWFTAAVKWASENKIVNGVGNGKFDPNANVTREQMCVMLVNYAKFKKITLKSVENKENFVDDGKISKWAKTAVYTCQQADIVNGKGEGKFDPQGTGTRAEASVIFTKFHKDYMVK